MIPTDKDIIEYITQKNAHRSEFGDKQNKPMQVTIKNQYVTCKWYIGQASGFGAFSKESMPMGPGVIRTEAYSEERYYINDVIVEMLSSQAPANKLKHIWLVNYVTDAYGKVLMENRFLHKDGWDDMRNASGNMPDISYRGPFGILLGIRSNIPKTGKVVEFKVERILPKHVSKTMMAKGEPFRIPLGFVFVKYENGTRCSYHITRAAIKTI